MEVGNFIEALERFFLDVVGYVIPGAALLQLLTTRNGSPLDVPDYSGTALVARIVVGYVLGFVVLSVGENVLAPVLNVMLAPLARAIFPNMATDKQLLEEIRGSYTFKAFLSVMERLHTLVDIEPADVHAARSLAMSLVPEQDQKVYRFTFLSQLCLGIFTALSITVLLSVLFTIAHAIWKTKYVAVILSWQQVVVYLLLAFLLLERRNVCYRRAMYLPFSIALGMIARQEVEHKAHASGSANP